MVDLVVFLNLFFVPVIALWCDYKSRNLPVEPTVKLLLEYVIFATLNVPLSKTFVVFFRLLTGFKIAIDSGYYTIMAILSSLFLVFLSSLGRTMLKKAKNRSDKQVCVLKGKQKVLLTAAVNFFFVFTIIVFTPYDIFFRNQSEFVFGFLDFWWIMASFGLLVFVILMTVFLKLPSRALIIALSLLFSITFCAYIQRMFFNLHITSMVGEALDIREHPIWALINLIIWLSIIVGTVILLNRKGELWKRVVTIVSSGLIIVQAVALISFALSGNIISKEENLVLTTDGLYEVASNHNIIVFLLDQYDLTFLDSVLAETPDFYDELEGFTRFDNMTSVYSRSYPSNTYLLTGLELDEYYVKPYADCVDKAFSESTFLPYLKDLGYSVDIYSNTEFVGCNSKGLVDNYKSGVKVLYFDVVREFLRGSFYFVSPYVVKPFFWFFNELQTKTVEDTVYNIVHEAPLYQRLQETGLSIGENRNSYKYIHTWGAHGPLVLNENCEEVEGEVERVQQSKGSMRMIYAYLDQMKALGVYDNATIIITADHGEVSTDLPFAVTPILFVKPAHAEAMPLKVSHAPVSHRDIFPTIIQEAGGEFESYGSGRSVFSIGENEQRERVFHWAEMTTDWEETYVVDYAITGNSRDLSNWEKLNSKRILESLYPVSEQN